MAHERNPERVLTTGVSEDWLKSHIHRSCARACASSLRSYPNGVSNRAADYIPPGFFCLSVLSSVRPSARPSFQRRQIHRGLPGIWALRICGAPHRGGTSSCEARCGAARRNAAHAVVEARAGSGRFVTSLFLSPPRPILDRTSPDEIAGRVFFDRVELLSPSERIFPNVGRWRGEDGKARGKTFRRLKFL